MKVLIQNETNTLQRIPVADEDIETLGEYLEFQPKSTGKFSRKLLDEGVIDRMRLQYTAVHDLINRNKFSVQ